MSEAPAFDFKAAIEKAIAVFEEAANAKDAAAIAGLYTENATLMPPGAPSIKGRANIQAFWQAFFAAGASDVKVRPVEVSSSGDMAYEIGAFEAILPNPQGGTSPATGKYLVAWKRQPDGGIQMVADIFNANA
jgi:uncharacterized protein (TIGR02246 family)